MDVQTVRELCALAEKVDGNLQMHYVGNVFVLLKEPGESEGHNLGLVDIGSSLHFVGADDPEGEGWESHSVDMSISLRKPVIVLEGGDVISIEEARARAGKL